MSISALFRLAKEYLILGLVLITLFDAIFLFGYLLVYKLLLKGRKKNQGKKDLIVVYLFYLYHCSSRCNPWNETHRLWWLRKFSFI